MRRTSFVLDGKVSVHGVWGPLGVFHLRPPGPVSDRALETLHEMAIAKNKSKRQLFPNVAITGRKH
jgi:hypothetical protein